MSEFAQTLAAFRSGEMTLDEVLASIHRLLTMERASPVALLETLAAEQSTAPLPDLAHQAIIDRLSSWPQDPTVATGLTERRRADHSVSAAVGDVLQGRFSLVALVGEGGMSRVFKAIDLRRVEAGAPDPYVAVKVLTAPFNQYFGSITSLQREAHKLQSLTHPNIVRVIDVDRDGQTVFMTMEYLAGESLLKKLRSRELSMDREMVGSLIETVGQALEYAHDNHIVHGDLKPANVIVTDLGVVKVIDFGVAQFIARPDGSTAPQVPPVKAPKAVTLRYASPEMAAGRDPAPADDVYALACMAYEIWSGKHPHDTRSLPRPEDMPPFRHQALVHALAPDRKQRTPTIRQFLEEFGSPRRDRSIKWWTWGAAAAIVLAVGILYYSLTPHGKIVKAVMPGAGTVIRDCPTCPLMTVLPAGRFLQGAGGEVQSLPNERPQHGVVIAYPFAMSTYEVTVGEFREFVEATHPQMSGCTTYDGRWQYRPAADWQAPGFSQSAEHPVTCVSWSDAVAYAQWLSRKSGHAYRLPSASEWEFAARAGADDAQPWSSNIGAACAYANVADQSAVQRFPGWDSFPCNDGYVNTAPVGTFKANAFGLYDLLGNVFEWVEDCWYDTYMDAPSDGSSRVAADCEEHELRGGSWFSSPRFVSASYRNRFNAAYRSGSIGFRLVRQLGK